MVAYRTKTQAAALVLVASALAGGSGCPTCTALGCDDGVRVELSDSVLAGAGETGIVRTCLDGECSQQEIGSEPGRPESYFFGYADLEPGDVVRVTVEVADEAGVLFAEHQEQAVFERFRPNGPRCPPECAVAHVTVE